MEHFNNKTKPIKRYIFLFFKIILVLMVLLLFWHELFVTQEYWNGMYYPKGDTNGYAIQSPRFDYKEECIGWAINQRGLRPEDKDVPLQDLWECNKNCRLATELFVLYNASSKIKQEQLDNGRGPFYYCDNGGFDGGDWLREDNDPLKPSYHPTP